MKGRSSIRNKVIIIIATFTVACAWFLLEVPRISPSFFVIISSVSQFFISSIDFYVPGHSVFNVTQIPLNRRFANWSSSISYNITWRSVCTSPGNPGTVRLEVSSMFGRYLTLDGRLSLFCDRPKIARDGGDEESVWNNGRNLANSLGDKAQTRGDVWVSD